MRVGVGQRGVLAQGFVDFSDFTADRHVNVGSGFDGFDHAGGFFLGNGLADGRQIHKDDIAQRFLCVEGDADAGVITVNLDPDMVFGVLGHGFFPSKKQGVE